MTLRTDWGDGPREVDFGAAIDLSRGIDFGDDQATAFGLPKALQTTVVSGDFIGDTRRGGSCNCRQLTLCPHGNGTHTESRQHIDAEAPSPAEVLASPFCPALLATITLQTLADSGESYPHRGEPGDWVVTAEALAPALSGCGAVEALVLRSRGPEGATPYFTLEAMARIVEAGLRHLIVEWPSIDRGDDGGVLANHHRFFDGAPRGTVTELARIPESARDGHYLLNLQLPNIRTDAVPSRPLLLPILEP